MSPTTQIFRPVQLVIFTVGSLALSGLMLESCHGADDWPAVMDKYIRRHCLDCHSDDAAEGKLNLESLPKDLDSPARFSIWERVYDRVVAGEMPPPDAERPSESDRAQFVSNLHGLLFTAHAATKQTVLRRLNRYEYENTLNDLFGTHLELAKTLPEDGRSHEFDNVGAALGLSMVQLQGYLEGIEAAVDASVVRTIAQPESKTIRASYADTRGAEKWLDKIWRHLDDGSVVFFKRYGYPTGMLREANVREAGRYRIRVTGYAFQSQQPITFSVGATTFARGLERPTFGYFEFPPGKPTTVELEVWLNANYMIEVLPWGISDNDNALKKVGATAYNGPGLAIQHIEVEGPVFAQYPLPGHDLLFEGLNRAEVMPSNLSQRKKSWYKPVFELQPDDLLPGITAALNRIVRKAYRRPVTGNDVRPYVELFQQEVAVGASNEDAFEAAVAAIFCSPGFLYFNERTDVNSPERALDDFSVACRLSYFLTRSLPDERLMAAAENRQLLEDNAVLTGEVDRLLSTPLSDRFVNDFTDAWLNLRDMDFTNPDAVLFPEFDSFLKWSMLSESRSFFRRMLDEDLGAVHIVKSDFAMLNNRLAEHYGVENISGPHFRPVPLPKDNVRGGILSHASVHKVSANGTNTSPVVRGVWVLERILGETPPPPPPGIPGVEPDVRGATTLREILDRHRRLDSCRGCHQVIDPPGFALESFNPIGGWRERFRSLGEGDRVDLQLNGRRVRYKLAQSVDASGTFPDGRRFDGFVQFRDELTQDPEIIATALTRKLLTFATGRDMGFSDREEISRIIEAAKASEYGLRSLIHGIVSSPLFLQK